MSLKEGVKPSKVMPSGVSRLWEVYGAERNTLLKAWYLTENASLFKGMTPAGADTVGIEIPA